MPMYHEQRLTHLRALGMSSRSRVTGTVRYSDDSREVPFYGNRQEHYEHGVERPNLGGLERPH